jgi:exodeoxyribonuclease VII large subunit
VADLRASTPTHAAQVLAHTRQRLLESAKMLTQQLVDTMRTALGDEESRLDGLREQLRLLHPMVQINEHTTRVQEQLRQITQGTRHALDGYERHLQGLVGRLDALSPLAVLARGYSITMAGRARRVITTAASVKPGDELETMLAKGRVFSTVSQVLLELRDGDGNHQ